MNQSRTSAIVAGALIVIGALWAPWFQVDLGDAARRSLGAGAEGLPGAFGEVARQLLIALPSRIEVTAWQAFEQGNVVLLVCALAAIFAALLRRMDVVAFAGAMAAVTTVWAMLDRPGPGELVTLRWGPWLALAGALLIVGASRMGAARPAAMPTPPPDWTKPTAPVAPAADPERSFAPF